MTRNRNNDWTDELRDIIDGVEMSPSEGGWERLNADLHPRRAVWWHYAVPVAACLLFGAVFLFREQPSGNVLDVATDVPSAMVAESALAEWVPEDVTLGKNSVTEPIRSENGPSPDPEPTMLQGSGMEHSSETAEVAYADSHEETVDGGTEPLAVTEMAETVPPSAKDERGPISAGPAEQTSSVTAEPENFPRFDFEAEPVARQRKQRRKISVTVSAGGAVGFNSGNRYLAQAMMPPLTKAPVTKAPADDGYSGRVMDVSELIVHERPVITNVGVSVPLSEKFELTSGLEYMQLSSSVLYGRQEQDWLGIPLKLGYSLWSWGPSAVRVGAGVKGEKCLSATLLGMDYSEDFQWAASMGLDCRVKLFGPVSFGLYPELHYYLTGTNLPVYRSNHPLSFTVCAGLSVSL